MWQTAISDREHQLRLTAQQCIERRTAALERYVREVDARQQLEQFGGQMRRCAIAARGVIQRPRTRPRQRQQIGKPCACTPVIAKPAMAGNSTCMPKRSNDRCGLSRGMVDPLRR